MSTWQKLGTSVAVTVTVSVTCFCWSLGHGEQLLFSCVSSKVTICNYVTCHLSPFTFHMSHVICEMLMLILWICWTIFVFMSSFCQARMTVLSCDWMAHGFLATDWILCWLSYPTTSYHNPSNPTILYFIYLLNLLFLSSFIIMNETVRY